MAGKTTAKTSSRSSDRKKPPSRGATAGGHGPGGGGDDGQPGPTAAPRDPQRLLDLFAAAFGPVLSSDRFPALLQDIKRALFRRDFAAAFADEAGLAAYAARWSPTRALCYAAVLLGLRARLEQMLDDDLDAAPLAAGGGGKGDRRRRLRVLSVGGCAAEQVAVAA
ncbi:hypothetical protein CDD83_2793 [Cordyceps sp. RAO-2017]|nr:hypothetical protein CDD83_2793 [Cordyceps sp. RAO-2017]